MMQSSVQSSHPNIRSYEKHEYLKSETRNKIIYVNTGRNKMAYTIIIIMDYRKKDLEFEICLKSETTTP